LCKYYGVGFRA